MKTKALKYFLVFILKLSMFTPVFSQLPTAQQIADQLIIGWNVGNSLEAMGGETAWGNPMIDQELIDAVSAAGFNTIRIPCSWDAYADQSTLQIDPAWLARVKEVVDYCYAKDMYVMLNIHWDGGWLENNVSNGKQASVNEKQNAYWTQIANYFVDYDEHLLFASANEPDVSRENLWPILLSYHQTFVDAVRATGGNNSSRVLIIQGPSTNIQKTYDWMTTLPTDQIADRLMVEVHYYTPWQFCGLTQDESWGDMFYFWGADYHSTTNPDRNATWGEEDAVESYFQMMQEKFVNDGIPVIMGEWGAIKRTGLTGEDLTLHIASREYYFEYVVDAAIRYGLLPVYWDNGYSGENGFALFDRNNGDVIDMGALEAMLKGAGLGYGGNILPSAAITSPLDATSFDEPATITIEADASDSDGSISSVSFYEGSTLLATDVIAPYSYTWSNVSAGVYYLTAEALDNQGGTAQSAVVRVSVGGGGSGTILREWWTDIGGESVSSLTSSPNYPDNPTGAEQITSFECPINIGDDYGTRVSGYIHPLTSGDYTFWIAGDNNCELWLSSSTNPFAATLIASVPGYTDSREWTKYPEQQSSSISLTGGTVYYIKALQKEGTGGDNLAVAWQIPGGDLEVIDGIYLSPWESFGNKLPTVSITSPSEGASFTEGDDISITADAADSDGMVTQVEFFEGTNSLGVDMSEPYSVVWNSAPAGSHTLTAVATDDSSASTTSAPVSITVNPVGGGCTAAAWDAGATYSMGDTVSYNNHEWEWVFKRSGNATPGIGNKWLDLGQCN